jgi:hypothetical protein
VRQGAPGATSCPSALRNAHRTFPHHQARGAGLPLHYQYRDCAALPNRPPGLALSPRRSPPGDRVIREGKRIWSHYFLLDVRKRSRALHRAPRKWPGFSLDYQLIRPRLGVALPNRLPGLAPTLGNRHVCAAEFIGLLNTWPTKRIPSAPPGSGPCLRTPTARRPPHGRKRRRVDAEGMIVCRCCTPSPGR